MWYGNTGGAGGGGGEDERIEADATATNPRHVDEQIDEETYGGQPKVNNSAFASIGVDAVEGEITEGEAEWLKAKLALYGMKAPKGVKNLTKIVAGKQLWNYDNLEPSEKKLVL